MFGQILLAHYLFNSTHRRKFRIGSNFSVKVPQNRPLLPFDSS